MKSKRSKCKYTRQSVLKIIRYNKNQFQDYNLHQLVLNASKEVFSGLFGNSFLNSLMFIHHEQSFFDEIINPKPVFFKLSRLKNK